MMLRVLTCELQGWSPLHVAASNKQHAWDWMSDNHEKIQSLQDAKHENLNMSNAKVTHADLHQGSWQVCEGLTFWATTVHRVSCC